MTKPFVLSWLVLVFSLLFVCFLYKQEQEQEQQQESFTPGIRQMYHSKYRNARIAMENFYSSSVHTMNVLLRKNGYY
jgi:hypothetical protein